MHTNEQAMEKAVRDQCVALLGAIAPDAELDAERLIRGVLRTGGDALPDDGDKASAQNLGRWAIAAAASVARAMLVGAGQGARDTITSAAVSWLGNELPRLPEKRGRSRLERGTEFARALAERGVPDERAGAILLAILTSGENFAVEALVGHGGEFFSMASLAPLRVALCDLYPRPENARRLLADARVEVSRVSASGAVENVWQEGLDEARKQHLVAVLVDRARAEYPRHDPLRAAAAAIGLL